jgi:hypothetical protein
MTLVLDAGALVAVERQDRAAMAVLRRAEQRRIPRITNSMIVAQVWRDGKGRQALLARFLSGIQIRPVTTEIGFAAGRLCAKAGTSDPIDAALVLLAADQDQIVTSDPTDIKHLVEAAGRKVGLVRC